MKQDPEYLKRLLSALQACPSPWPSMAYLEEAGVTPDGKMLFHLQLLNDNGFIQPIDKDSKFGFMESVGEEFGWTDTNLRLTAQGHEFIEALDKEEVWNVIKDQFRDATLRTIFDVGRALVNGFAREQIKKYVGDVKI